MPLGRRAGGLFVVVVLVAFLAAVVAGRAGAAVPTSGPAGAAYVQLQTTRAALANAASAYADPYPRGYINNAVLWLDDALQSFRWTSTGLVLNDHDGLGALTDMRQAAAWLVWGDTGLRDATVSDQRNIVWSMGQIAQSRLTEVSGFIGEGSGPDPWLVWASGYFLGVGDSLLADDLMHSSLYYISAWQYLLGQPPCC